jgi:hypothetical protein
MEIAMCCLEVTKNAKSSTAIVHIERDLEDIDAAFEKIQSDITNIAMFVASVLYRYNRTG